MKVLCCIKRVVDYQVKVLVKKDGSDVDLTHVKMAINPFDEIAVEQAVQMKEQGGAEEIVVVSIGSPDTKESLRQALAMGADRAILVETDVRYEPINIAKILHAVAQQEKPGMVLMGKQAIDDDCNQTGQMLAALLDWPQGTFTSKINIKDNKVNVTREVDEGLETLELNLPCVITTDLRLNEPRYISMPNIMKAKQKPLEIKTINELNLKLKPHLELLAVAEPAMRKAGIKVNDLNELMDKLKNEAQVL